MRIRANKGFTLIELLVVIILITILTAIGISQFNIYTRNNALQSAARELAGDIQRIRQRAMAGGATTVPLPYTLQFLDNTRYTYTLPADVPPYPPVIVTKNVTTFFRDITFVQNFLANTITFQSRGSINFGTVTLTNDLNTTVTLTATPPIGRINVVYATE